jgi:hypothetical protein
MLSAILKNRPYAGHAGLIRGSANYVPREGWGKV